MSGDERGARELAAAGYAWEIADAPVLHRSLTLADMAHAIELSRVGVLPADSLLAEGLLALWEVDAEDMGYDPSLGEVYTSREHWLRDRIGDDAGFLHHGRTRREAVRTAFRMASRRAIADLVESVTRTVASIDERAVAWQDVVLPDYTYLQPAQPTTFGHYLLSFADPLIRDARRLLLDLEDVDSSPAGSGAANGSTLPIDRDRVATQLGFARSARHLRDAMWQTDPFLHATLDAASVALTLDRLAEDLETYASREFGFVSLGDGLVRPSVLMPQKRNPYALSVVRGTAAILIGRATGQLALAKSPSARSDSLIFAYGEVPRALDAASRVATLMTAVVDTLSVNRERMREALRGSNVEAADIAGWLATSCGLDYGRAHTIVAAALAGADVSVSSLERAAGEILGRDVTLDAAEFESLRDPEVLLRRRSTPGGPGDVTSMASANEIARQDMMRTVEHVRDRWDRAEDDTIRVVRQMAAAR